MMERSWQEKKSDKHRKVKMKEGVWQHMDMVEKHKRRKTKDDEAS